MRVVGGRHRGRRLATPAGKTTRPTADRARESLFNILAHGDFGDRDVFTGARVFDAFCGSGALGLEALSRGAESVTFVDDGRVAQGLITKNIDLCRARDQARLIRRSALKLGDNPDAPYSLIFLDPPYGKALGEKALAAAMAGGWVADDALVVWEENAPMAVPEGFELHDSRKYGDTHISLMWRQ